MAAIYSNIRWRRLRARALARDGHSCTVARLLGGACSGALHAHHIVPIEDGGPPFELDNVATVCASHHPVWESLRATLVDRRRRLDEMRQPPRCRHRHRTLDARLICEARLARQRRGRRRVAAI